RSVRLWIKLKEENVLRYQEHQSTDTSSPFLVQALVEMRQQLIDNSGVLNDWKDNQMSPCYWNHVICQDNKVTSINLAYNDLSGEIPVHLLQVAHYKYMEDFDLVYITDSRFLVFML
ncbi:unnamed protein product, partial [Urochloa humidicola]